MLVLTKSAFRIISVGIVVLLILSALAFVDIRSHLDDKKWADSHWYSLYTQNLMDSSPHSPELNYRERDTGEVKNATQ